MPSLPDRRLSLPRRWRIGEIVRALMGVPDYARYLAHHAQHHGESQPLSRAEFFEQRQMARFGRGASRCC